MSLTENQMAKTNRLLEIRSNALLQSHYKKTSLLKKRSFRSRPAINISKNKPTFNVKSVNKMQYCRSTRIDRLASWAYLCSLKPFLFYFWKRKYHWFQGLYDVSSGNLGIWKHVSNRHQFKMDARHIHITQRTISSRVTDFLESFHNIALVFKIQRSRFERDKHSYGKNRNLP